MKVFVILALLALTVSAGSLDKFIFGNKKLLKGDECFSKQVGLSVSNMKSMMAVGMAANSLELMLKKESLAEAKILQDAFDECDVKLYGRNTSEWLELLGVGFLIGSECFKNVGATLLLVHDYLLLDPTAIDAKLLKLMIQAFY